MLHSVVLGRGRRKGSGSELGHVLHAWPQRFIEIYQRGCELMIAPTAPLSTFHEEGYLRFLKCLECMVMGKTLDRSGQFNEKHFHAACDRLRDRAD